MEPGLIGEQEWNAHQRAGFVVILLQQKNMLTTAEIARLTGLSYKGAYYMMHTLLLLPWQLWQDDEGRWRVGDFACD